MSFHKGDTIVELRKMAGEWWRGSCNGQRGYFPKSYVAVIGEGVVEAQRGNVFHSEKPPLARAMFDFVGQSEQELTFKEGDVIGQVNQGADKESAWWQGTRGGRTGYFPREYVVLVDQKRRKTPYTANVVYRFDARDPKSQLSLVVGEMIEVLELCDEVTGGWWVGRKGDKVGYFPANYARYTAKTCEKCQLRPAKAKVTLGAQRTVHWFCRPCVQSMDSSAVRPPKAGAPAAAAGAKAGGSQPQAVPQQAKAQQAPAAVATSPNRGPAAAPAPTAVAAAALPPAPAPVAAAAPAPAGNDAASARLAALGMVPKATPKGAASPVVSRPAAAQQAAKLPPPPGGAALPPPPQAVGGGGNLPPPPQAVPPAAAAAAAPLRQSRDPQPQPQRQQQRDDSDDDSDDSEDTDDVSSDDDDGEEGGGLTYVEMLRQEYRKHLPAPEDMRADFGKAPAPPRPQ